MDTDRVLEFVRSHQGSVTGKMVANAIRCSECEAHTHLRSLAEGGRVIETFEGRFVAYPAIHYSERE